MSARQTWCPSLSAVALAVGLALLGASVAEAQQTTGSLLGTVSDTGGGAIAGAAVTATRSPTAMRFTPEPTCTTVPHHSWPGMIGYLT